MPCINIVNVIVSTDQSQHSRNSLRYNDALEILLQKLTIHTSFQSPAKKCLSREPVSILALTRVVLPGSYRNSNVCASTVSPTPFHTSTLNNHPKRPPPHRHHQHHNDPHRRSQSLHLEHLHGRPSSAPLPVTPHLQLIPTTQEIPPGKVTTYGHIARLIDRRKAPHPFSSANLPANMTQLNAHGTQRIPPAPKISR